MAKRLGVALAAVMLAGVVAWGASDGSDGSDGVERDDGAATQARGDWAFGQAMSSRRSYIAASQVGKDIYVAGGMVGETGRPLATFQRYSALADRWTTLSPLPVATRAGAAAAVEGKVYVVGGQTATATVGGLYVYDPRSGLWSEGPDLPSPRFNHEALALGGRLYVLGGYDDGQELSEVYTYDPAQRRWELETRLPRVNHAFGAVVYRGEIWVIGGRRGEAVLREVWVYSPETRRWRAGPELPRAMELLGAAVWGGQIHALWESTYQVYDGARWRQGPSPQVTRHALSLFAFRGRLYAIGGCTTALKDSPIVETRALAEN